MDGAAGVAADGLGERTALESTELPHVSKLADRGRVGRALLVPAEMTDAPGVALLSVAGYDPRRWYGGPGPMLAASRGIRPGDQDWAACMTLVTTGVPGHEYTAAGGSLVVDSTSGGISDSEARVLWSDLAAAWRHEDPELARGLTITPCGGPRAVLTDDSGRNYRGVVTHDPAGLVSHDWRAALPAGGAPGAADALARLVAVSARVFASHEVNLARSASGLLPATLAWVWGLGQRPTAPLFVKLHGLSGGLVASADVMFAVGDSAGWERVAVRPRELASAGRASQACLDRHDFVCCHTVAPTDPDAVPDFLAEVDRAVVGPLMTTLDHAGDAEVDPHAPGWRLMLIATPGPGSEDSWSPFVIAGAWVRSVVPRPFTEHAVAESDLRIEPGHELMEYFLFGGKARARTRPDQIGRERAP